MDIKFSFLRVVLFFAILTLVISTTSAGYRKRGNGRIPSRRHNRREIREYLAPPSQDASYINYGPTTTEAPGYFSRFFGWLNPFGRSPTPPPLPDLQVAGRGSPPPRGYGPPQPPPAGRHGYLPPNDEGKNCHPCDKIPWVPMAGSGQHDTDASGAKHVDIQPSISAEANGPGVGSFGGFPDFTWEPLTHFASGKDPYSGPIPYHHLYPGPMPPLYKTQPFAHSSGDFRPTPSIQLESGPSDQPIHETFYKGYVEALPPGAEVQNPGDVGEIRDSPPPGYEDGHHGTGYESTQLNVQPSTIIHEDHLSAELTAGYKVHTPGTTNVELVQSVPATDFPISVDHPIHYEESPLIDLSKPGPGESDNDYAAGLNPPPNESPQSYADSQTNGGLNTLTDAGGPGYKNSYGVPVSHGPPKDSFVASTVMNRTFSYPTPSYGIPDVGRLPITHEATKATIYESYPPSTEKVFTSVSDPVGSPTDSSKNGGARHPNGSSQEQSVDAYPQNDARVVDSYQQYLKQPSDQPDQQNGQSGIISTPEPLVPYRPDLVYVPYPPYTGPNVNLFTNFSNPHWESEPSGPTTEESFLKVALDSYDAFKREMAEKDKAVREEQLGFKSASQNNREPTNSGSFGGTTWVSQPQPSFSNPEQINPSVYVDGKMVPLAAAGFNRDPQPPGAKKTKQVQIIIPYTSQDTPSPFQPVADDWSGRGPLQQTQGRKVPALSSNDHNYIGEESNRVEIVRPSKSLEKLLNAEIAKKPSPKQANNSIDVSRLQKNIDNWTIQEYSRGITSSTALPSSSHPYLLPAKKIPSEYLNSNQSSVSENGTDVYQTNLPGLNYNDLEHEGSASSHVDVPHVQVLTVEGVSKPVDYKTQSHQTVASTEATTSTSSSATSTSTTTTQASWAELPVSISPLNNERVYVVTPQPARSAKSWPGFSNLGKSGKFEAIERAYQVLPQAVNNLATTSVSGPEHSPLWGIMEHDMYARNYKDGSTTSIPILYSGHSKVSNSKSQ